MASLSNDKPANIRLSSDSCSVISGTSTVSSLSSTLSSSLSTETEIRDDDFDSTQNIRVVTRVRPLSTKELTEQSKELVSALDSAKTIEVASSTSKKFVFDAVFGPETTQRAVYEQTAGDMIRNNLFKGFNVTVLACKYSFLQFNVCHCIVLSMYCQCMYTTA